MQRKTLAVAVVVLFLLVAVAPMAASEDSEAESDVPRPYPENPTKFCKFNGIVKHFGDYLPADKLHVIIVAAYYDTADQRYYFTDKPGVDMVLSKEEVLAGDSPFNFSIDMPKITDGNFKYFLCVENGYRIAGVSDKLDGTPVKVHPYPYMIKSPDTDPPWGSIKMPTYTAFMIRQQTSSTAFIPDTFDITGNTADSFNVISLAPAKVTVSGSVMSGKFALVNANVDFCRISTPDVVEYTAITDKNGYYYIEDVNTGTYIVKVYTNGYTAENQVVDVLDGELNVVNIEMKQNDSGYFGYDLPHFLLIMGGIIGVILIVVSLFFQYWVVNKKHNNWVYNDMEDEDSK